MKTILPLFILISTFSMAQTPANIPSAEIQIKGAMLAAPAASKDGAMVYGYSPKGDFTVLRRGTNEMVCLADDPALDGFSASCYHSDLEPFMERGRVLRDQGKNTKEITEIRETEVQAGTLQMPDQPTTLYVYFAPKERYDLTTGEVKGDFRYVVYIPYATAASTGLPTRPEAPGMPWIMDPGTHRAHIMINPPLTSGSTDN